jgi:hypothetical protein
MRHFKKIIFFIILYTATVFAQHSAGGIEVFSAKDIREKGLINLNDIDLLSNRLDKISINGYSGKIVFKGLPIGENSNITILVNGQKIDLAFLSELNLDVLPFNIDQIDTIKIVGTNKFYKGYTSSFGLIEFILVNDQQGFSLKAFQSIGNEVGDPGPYAYTPYQTPNVDKLGFLAGMTLKSAGNNWDITTNLKFNENFVTDQAISPRIKSLSKDSKARLLGANGILSYRFLNGNHQLLFNFSENDDFIFTPIYGNEIPAKRIHRHIGFSGNFPISKRLLIEYIISNGVNEYARSFNERNYNFNLKVNSTMLSSNLTYSYKHFRSLVGLSYNKYDGNRTGKNNDETIEFMESKFELGIKFFNNIYQNAGIKLVKNRDRTGKEIYLNTEWNLTKRHFLSLNTSFSERWLNEDLNLISWTQNGHSILNIEDTPLLSQIDNSKKTLSIDLRYSFNSSKISIGTSLFYKKHDGFFIENSLYNFNRSTRTFKVLQNSFEDQSSNVLGNLFNITYSITPIISNTIDLSYFTHFNETEAFENEWKKIPKMTVNYNLKINVSNSFLISGAMRYISETEWSNYKFVDIQSGGKYSNTLEQKLLVDLSLQKSFWKDRIWLSLFFKNIFNQEEIYNPIGVNLGLRFYLQTRIKLNNLFN